MDKNKKNSATATSELIKCAVKGDFEAFGELVRMYERFVYNLAFKFSFSEQDAYDISQEVFIKVWRSLSTFRFDCEFSTWLYRITHNTCLDYSRKRTRTAAISMTECPDSADPDERVELDIVDISAEPSESLLKKERISVVREAISQLMPEHREIIILRDIEDCSYLQISEMLSLDIGTVKSRLSRARVKLKEILQSRNIL
ncbi:MAG: sigma-70 family RNA polymerase sigma factor [Clostridiales bacterium]|nr:sigma-70 family RNA polymerase sigma factor [Clostridiales bacterium]